MLLTGNDFEKMFDEPLSSALKNKIDNYGLKYRHTNNEETEDCLKTIISYLIKPNPVFAGEHRLDQWEKGWRENLEAIEGAPSLESILPLYFGKYDRLRLNQKSLPEGGFPAIAA